MALNTEDAIVKKLDLILDEIRATKDQFMILWALQATEKMGQRDAIAFLSRAGFPPKQIAQLLGTTSNTVSVTLHQIKRTLKGD